MGFFDQFKNNLRIFEGIEIKRLGEVEVSYVNVPLNLLPANHSHHLHEI